MSTSAEVALFEAAAHAVAPDLVEAPDLFVAGGLPHRSGARVWEAIRRDARVRAIRARLTRQQVARARDVLEAMCRELTDAADGPTASRRRGDRTAG